MGLLSFLGKKPSADSKSLYSLKAQPYNDTQASLPPIRGVYPVAGNGSTNILEQYRKTCSPSHHGEPFQPEVSAADAPIVHRFREDIVERPQTAPSEDQGTPAWSSQSRTDSLKGPAVATYNAVPTRTKTELLYPPRMRPPFKLPPKTYTPTVLPRAAPEYDHERTYSLRSTDTSSSKGFVDILDAQSALKPLNFHDRLHATGARNYGEDVADRNIRENGLDLSSYQAPALHGRATPTDSTPAPTLTRNYDDLAAQEGPGSRSRHRHSIGSNKRTHSLQSSSAIDFASGTSSHGPSSQASNQHLHSLNSQSEDSDAAVPNRRRQSLHSYVAASSSTNRPSSNSSQRRRALDPEADKFPDKLKSLSRYEGTAVDDSKLTRLSRPASMSRLRSSAQQPKDSVILARNKAPEMSARLIRISENDPSTPTRVQRSSLKPSPRRETTLYAKNSTDPRTIWQRRSLQRMASNTAMLGDIPDRLRPYSPEFATARRNPEYSTGPFGSTYAERRTQALQQASDGASSQNHAADQYSFGLGRLSPASNLQSSDRSMKSQDYDESATERTNSLRDYSMDSETATISSLSSNPFRPQSSRHTANTSVDLAPDMKSMNSSYETLGSVSYRTAPELRAHSSLASVVNSPPREVQRASPAPDFNIDDYISSDDESRASCRPGGEGEEDLLFRDIEYSLGGSQLPGIPGLFSVMPSLATPPPPPPRSGMRAFKLAPLVSLKTDHSDIHIPGVPSPLLETDSCSRLSSFRMPSYEYAESEDGGVSSEDTEDELTFDIPLTRRASTVRYYPDVDDFEEEKAAEVMDINNAIKLRKEAKRQNRALGVSVLRRTANGKDKDILQQRQVFTGDSDADIE